MNLKHVRPSWFVLATVIVVVLLAAGTWWLLSASSGYPDRIRIATGAGDGPWSKLGDALVSILSKRFPDVEFENVKSEGSVENAGKLGTCQAELALLQNDTDGDTTLRVIAPLYDEFLQVIVRNSPGSRIDDITQLRGRTVAIGPPGSGTKVVAQRVLKHFDLADLKEEPITVEAAGQKLLRHEIDAVFVFAGLLGEEVSDLLQSEQTRLLALGDFEQRGSALDGLCVADPYFNRAVIPARTFGTCPERAVGTISMMASLVCREDLDSEFVYELTSLLFEKRNELSQNHADLARLNETFDASMLHFPLHEGAADWYHRNDPAFYVRYADVMTLAFTVLLAAVSALLAARQWIRRRQKNRIDVYYIEIEQIARRTPNATREQLRDMQRMLERVRRHAFHDLVRERVLADESFRIFQAFLQAEFQTIRSRILDLDRRKSSDGGATSHA